MTGLDSIIREIRDQAEAEAEQLRREALSEAERRAADILSGYQKQAEALEKHAGEKAVVEKRNAAEAAEVAGRQAMLRARAELLEQTLEKARKKALSLDNAAYADLLCGIILRYAPEDEGRLRLNKRDADRLPADFEQKVAAALKAAGKNARFAMGEPISIDGGVVMDFDETCVNCSFEALFAEKREELSDALSRILFA